MPTNFTNKICSLSLDIISELDTDRVDPRVGLGRVGSQNLYNLAGLVGSGQVTKFAKKCAIFELSHICCRSGSVFVK